MDFNVDDRIMDEKRDLAITDKKYFTQGNRKAWYYKYHCNICGYDCDGGYIGGRFKQAAWFSRDQLGRRKAGCPCCSHKLIVPHINSIRVTNPELSQYFLNDEDMKYSVYSGKRINLKCPFCGTIKENMVISSLLRQGIACPVCSDNISIGERIIYYILSRSGMDFKKEFMFPDNKWRYDFYIPKYNAIVEVHGEQHYKQTSFCDLSKNQQNDVDKKDFALNNGIDKYIEINAMKSDYDYIVNSIVNSDFSKIYDLNFVDWAEIKGMMFGNNIVKNICEYWENNKVATYVDMEKLFGFSESTIRKYLRIGYKLGWCHEEESHFHKSESCHIKGTYDRKYPLLDTSIDSTNNTNPILYVPENIYFKGAALCSRLSEEVLGKRIPDSTIRYKLRRDSKEFKFITKEEFNNAFYNNERCYGTPFDEALLRTS